jgi:multidrug efflux pump subunit AcrA (membrane-fusion protein)
MIDNYTEMVQKKSANFERVRELKMRSQVEKDRDFYDLLASKNQLATVRKELENMRLQVSDLKLRQRQLERSIADKRLAAPGYTLYALLVKESQVVAPGTPLAQVADVSRAKLTLFLSEAERQGISDKVIYLDGAKTDYRIDRLWNIADDTHLSSYRAEIIIDAPDAFSRLVKVEFRDE